MSHLRGDADAPIFTISHDGAGDPALLRRIGQGDEDAMASFYREHGRVVLAQVLLVTGERALAEEIVQDTMLAAWRGAGSFRGESSVRSSLLSDITDGASVMVRGSSSDGTIAAAIVTVGPPFSAVNPPGFVPVRGTVSDATTAGFTLVTSTGTRVPVTTSSDTLVVVPHASPGQLQAGATIFAVGHAGPDGTLLARGVAAITQFRSGATLHVSVSVRDCSPSSITEALAAISAAPFSGG